MRYLFVHAHPDDETLSSGAIILTLLSQGHPCLVLTATRGEMGQAIPGTVPSGGDLVTIRQKERDRALATLGATDAGWLGQPPNRANNKGPRIYRDSGMTAIENGAAAADSLCQAELDEVVGDLIAAALHHRAEALVSYDSVGGYGHPDHIRCYQATRQAALVIGVPRFEIVADPSLADQWYDLAPPLRTILIGAHQRYPTQFRVSQNTVIHVGGETATIGYAWGLRLA